MNKKNKSESLPLNIYLIVVDTLSADKNYAMFLIILCCIILKFCTITFTKYIGVLENNNEPIKRRDSNIVLYFILIKKHAYDTPIICMLLTFIK